MSNSSAVDPAGYRIRKFLGIQDPDLYFLFTGPALAQSSCGTDPRVRVRIKTSQIRNTGI